ncbi:hypothetical protein [Mesobacterium pallidum]|uniref:hypothetical protein n=1 Tax=Mesobacterium pallidum TaxID=2872037 RepID=UPI001EE3272C|nr:hypothetical protein [Mesobacterium pallidum]
MTMTIDTPRSLSRIGLSLLTVLRPRPAPEPDLNDAEDVRRDFILGRMADAPDAFASEYDVAAMALHFPRSF